MPSLRGQLLLAAPAMLDPNFEHCVVLVVEHHDEGALGLVLNRPTDLPVRDAVADATDADVAVDAVLHRGGPCEGPLMAVHADEQAAQATVLPGVYFATEQSFLERVLGWTAGPAKFFAGYAGWGPGQLDAELAQGAWLVTEASVERVFTTDGQAWSRLVRLVSSQQRRRALNPRIVPEDPTVN